MLDHGSNWRIPANIHEICLGGPVRGYMTASPVLVLQEKDFARFAF